MKRLLMLLVVALVFGLTSFAKQKQYKHGEITAHLSGNRVEIVDNVKNVCIVVEVNRSKNSVGDYVYEVLCNNKKTKNLTKTALKSAISSLIATQAPYASGIIPYANSIASDLYDDVCNYFAE